jgi:DeoR family transcriptional regulator of aga operon
VVAAAEKLGRRSFARICGVDAVRTLVTDTSADPVMVESLRAKGLQVILV